MRTPPRRFPAAVQFPGGAGRVRCRHQALRHRTAQPGRRGAPRTHGTAPAGAGDAAGPSGLTSASPTTLHDWTRAGHLGKQAASSSRMAPQPGRHRWHPQASSGTIRPHWAPRGTAGHRQSPPGTTGLTSSHQALSGVTKPPSPRQAAPGPITPHQVPLGPTGPRRVPPEPTGQAA